MSTELESERLTLPVPSLPISDALTFADPTTFVLRELANPGPWMDAVVLGIPFWDDERLGEAINLAEDISPAQAASIRFDPERQVTVKRFANADSVTAANREALGEVRSVAVEGSEVFLAELLDFSHALTELRIRNSTVLVDLSCVASRSLTELALRGCAQLGNLDGIDKLVSLRKLSIYDCVQLSCVMGLSQLKLLETLDINSCGELRDLSPARSLSSLKRLTFYQCGDLTDATFISSMVSLEELSVRSNWEGDASFLAPLRLKELYLNNTLLSDISALQHISRSLMRLTIASEITDATPLTFLTSLKYLNLQCPALRDVSVVSSMTSLEELVLWGSPKVRDLSAVSLATSLRSLAMSLLHVPESVELPCLSPLTSLGELEISFATRLVDLSGVSSLSSLRKLTIENCDELRDVSQIENLTGLRELHLSSCSELSDISPLASLTSLEKLDLSFSSDEIDVSILAPLTNLQRFEFLGRFSAEGSRIANTWTSLVELDLSFGEGHPDLASLATLSSLRSLALTNCDDLGDVSTLLTLPSLRSLDFTDSTNVSKVPSFDPWKVEVKR